MTHPDGERKHLRIASGDSLARDRVRAHGCGSRGKGLGSMRAPRLKFGLRTETRGVIRNYGTTFGHELRTPAAAEEGAVMYALDRWGRRTARRG